MDRREREVRLLARAYKATVTLASSNHWKLTLPNGAVVIAAGTSGDRRNLQNLRAQLRRAAAGQA